MPLDATGVRDLPAEATREKAGYACGRLLPVLLLMAVLSQPLFTLVRSNFMSFPLFTARHNALVLLLLK
jgi:hypothetical protein